MIETRYKNFLLLRVVAVEAEARKSDYEVVGSSVVHKLFMVVMLFLFWYVLSGRSDTKFLIYGVITAVVTTQITYPLLLVPNQSRTKCYFVFGVSPLKGIKYFFWLMYQLVLANIDVLLATTDQELAIDPRVLKFRFTADNPVASVVLANSITLTPGTVTMDVTNDGVYTIHALTPGAAEGIMAGDFPAHVARLFDEENDFLLIDDGSEIDEDYNVKVKGEKA